MAEYAKMTYGSLAYDPFGTAAPQIEIPEEPREARPEPEAKERPAERVRIVDEEAVRIETKNRRSMTVYLLLTIPAMLVCTALLLLLLRSYSRLTALSAESAAMESRITELKAEQKRLEVLSESAYNMEEVEQKARSVYGMIKADGEQFVYLHDTAEDVAVILDRDAVSSDFAGRFLTALEKVKAYFTRFGS